MITSRTNPKLKKVRKLLSSASERRRSGLFVIEGTRLFAETPKELIVDVLISDQAKDPGLSGYPGFEVVEHSLFRGLSDTMNPQGILAVVRKPVWEEPAGKGKTLLLDGIRDPGNLGTMIRTAEAAGVRGVYMSPDCVDLYNPKVIRSTMGSIFRVPCFLADLPSVIRELQKKGTSVYATSLSATRSFREADLRDAGIIIGSEASGISKEVLSIASEHIKIPMAGRVESLNAAVSAAVLLFCQE